MQSRSRLIEVLLNQNAQWDESAVNDAVEMIYLETLLMLQENRTLVRQGGQRGKAADVDEEDIFFRRRNSGVEQDDLMDAVKTKVGALLASSYNNLNRESIIRNVRGKWRLWKLPTLAESGEDKDITEHDHRARKISMVHGALDLCLREVEQEMAGENHIERDELREKQREAELGSGNLKRTLEALLLKVSKQTTPTQIENKKNQIVDLRLNIKVHELRLICLQYYAHLNNSLDSKKNKNVNFLAQTNQKRGVMLALYQALSAQSEEQSRLSPKELNVSRLKKAQELYLKNKGVLEARRDRFETAFLNKLHRFLADVVFRRFPFWKPLGLEVSRNIDTTLDVDLEKPGLDLSLGLTRGPKK